MALLPYWPKDATLSHNMLAFAAWWSWVAFVMGIVGGATAKWVRTGAQSRQQASSQAMR